MSQISIASSVRTSPTQRWIELNGMCKQPTTTKYKNKTIQHHANGALILGQSSVFFSLTVISTEINRNNLWFIPYFPFCIVGAGFCSLFVADSNLEMAPLQHSYCYVFLYYWNGACAYAIGSSYMNLAQYWYKCVTHIFQRIR